jgi:asparagine synthetase B (glutamine-hydrolysing)
MSGLAGAFFVPAVADAVRDTERAAALFAGPRHHVLSYVDSDAVLVVASRFPDASFSGSYGEIAETDLHVVAMEGYILNMEELIGSHGSPRHDSRARLLLEAFVREGSRALAALQGAYTIVIWNKAEKSATIDTCRFGQRHLYSRSIGSGLAIASDLGALRALSGAAFELDADTAWMSLLYGGVYGTATPIKNVRKVLPGTTLTIRRGGVSEALSRDLSAPRELTGGSDPPPESGSGQTKHHLDRLDAALRAAVRRLGRVADSHALMIGSGVDSSLVAAYAREEIRDLIAITQQMPGTLDESRRAARIAEALGIPHQVAPYRFTERNLLEDVACFVRIAEEPAYWNQLGPPLLSLLQSLRERPHAFLTGAEGDFLFNYRTRPVSVARVIRHGLFRPVAAHVARRLVNRVTRHTYIVGSDFDLLDRPLMRRHMATCPDIAQGGYYVHSYDHLPEGPNAQRHFLDNGWQNVRIISQFGREFGSEVLFPYMDDEVVSSVLALPDEMKINKVPLRMLLRRFLPTRVVPTKKTGYWAHTIRWHYETNALQDVLDLLTERKTIERGVYDRGELAALVQNYATKAAEPRHHPILWQLLIFEMFCREFVDAQ